MNAPVATLDFATYQRLVQESGPPRMCWFPLGEVAEAEIGFAVHIAFFNSRLVLVRNRERNCWELPGGRREPGETILETARRELEEECGVTEADIRPWCGYTVTLADRLSHGMLCLGVLKHLPGPTSASEIGEARTVECLPGTLCYPHIQGRILHTLSNSDQSPILPGRLPILPPGLLSILANSPPDEGMMPPIPAEHAPSITS